MSRGEPKFSAFLASLKPQFEEFLSHLLPTATENHRLSAAMRYSALNSGKRLRPMLVYATAEFLDTPLDIMHGAAASVELIHCYSLIHDDLPAMDDDDLRRGMPSCHKAFDEATAILAGDALQSLAFQILSDPELNPLSPQQQIAMVNALAKASGNVGMVLGQAKDLAAEQQVIDLPELSLLHKHKTGALFNVCIELSFLASSQNANLDLQRQLLAFGDHLGLAFQIQDDVLDVIGDPETLGKPLGSDQKLQKTTFCSLMGVSAAQEYAAQEFQAAHDAIASLGNKADILRDLAAYLKNRSY